jgi:CubicO group peptidase (beta-lactamase class C family)
MNLKQRPGYDPNFFKQGLFITLTVILVLLCVSNGWSAAPITGETMPGLEAFDLQMVRVIDKYDIPGATLAVSFKGNLVLARGYGYAHKSFMSKVSVQPQNRFRLASLCKPFTATAIMILNEEGKLPLEARIIPLLEELAPPKIRDDRVKQISVQHLLEHRAGFDRKVGGDPMLDPKPPCPGDLASFLSGNLDYSPGEKFAYSNVGYCILGRIIEKVTKKAYLDFLKERILEPLGIRSIELGDSIRARENEVSYFWSAGEKPLPYGGFKLEGMDAVGGLIGNAVDYLRFLTSVDGQRLPRLIAPSTFSKMLSMPDDPSLQDKPTYYAKGFNVRKLQDGGVNFWHYGRLPGTSTVAIRTATGYGWVALLNRRFAGDMYKVNIEVDRALWDAARWVKEVPVGDLFYKY